METPGEVYRISAANQAQSQDLNRRMKAYMAPMLFRALCLPIIVLVDHPIRWAFAAFAIFAPYVAVLLANQSKRAREAPVEEVPKYFTPIEAPEPQEFVAPQTVSVTLEGEILEGEIVPRN